MPRVQRVPRGLLALFDIVGEQPPAQLADQYHGEVAMLELILAEIPTQNGFTINAAAVAGTTIVGSVPAGEMWFLVGFDALVATASGVNNILNLVLIQNGIVVTVNEHAFVSGQNWPAVTANQTLWYQPPKPVLLKPGDAVQGKLLATTAGGVQTMLTSWQYKSIPV